MKSLKELEDDINHTNQLLKSLQDTKGNIIQLKLEMSDGLDLIKDIQLWKLFVKIFVYILPDDINSLNINKYTIFNTLKYKHYLQFRCAVAEFTESQVKTSSNTPKNNQLNRSLSDIYKENLDEESKECPICFDNEATQVVASCTHAFCTQCINQWRSRSKTSTSTCPICRTEQELSTDLDFELVDNPDNNELFSYLQQLLKRRI